MATTNFVCDEYKGYKIGDMIRILKEPSTWNSRLCNKKPLTSKVVYPYVAIIKDLYDCSYGEIAMSAGGYGWSLSDLIKTQNIEKVEADLPEHFGSGSLVSGSLVSGSVFTLPEEFSTTPFMLDYSVMSQFYSQATDPLFKLPIKKNKPTIMKKLSNFITKTVDSNTQELLKAGYINGNLEPTEKGYEKVREIIWFQNLPALTEAAKADNIEEAKESKKD
jgi:hypothetical protein